MSGVRHPVAQYVFMAWCLVKHRDKFTVYGQLHFCKYIEDIES
jgi:hypothetical protein